MLALKMGWSKERSPGNYDLGPNLCQKFSTNMVPNLETMTHDLKNDWGQLLFWLIGEELFHLSVSCNWQFTNFNKVFQNIVGSTSRSLVIYSNVGGSSKGMEAVQAVKCKAYEVPNRNIKRKVNDIFGE